MMNIFNKNSKAFTIIELIVVVAILGILVLLAGPRLLGYVEKAELARIQHDVKVAEGVVGEHLVKEGSLPDIWEDSNLKNSTNSIYDKTGLVTLDEVQDKDYKIVPKEEVSSKLPGSFHANKGGKVYYVGANPEQPEDNNDGDIGNNGGLRKPIEGEIAIDSAEKLAKIGQPGEESEYPLDGKYILTSNIDLSSFDNWLPIGNNSSNNSDSRFTGSFDGNGYNITGLKINSPGVNLVGLFGYIQGATIKNVALEDVDITGRDRTGGLVGWANNSSTISNSYATGSVSGGDSTGGLVGRAWGSTITNSYATVSVTGTRLAGGLVGATSYSNIITKSYATGSVSGTGGSMGGLVGLASESDIISNSYATGSVTSTKGATGGLVGYAWGEGITNSYATGSVKGTGNEIGGLVGSVNGSSFTNSSYWDKETTGRNSSAGGLGRSTIEMKMRDTYTGWDFKDIWQIDEGKSYPTLR